MQVRRLISILIIFSILMQNVAVPVLPSMMWIQTANASENDRLHDVYAQTPPRSKT